MHNDQTPEKEENMEVLRNAAIRLTMMPRDTNAHGTVFGGVILSYIDVAGGVEAVRHTKHERFVTVAMKEVIFHEPVFIGDLVSFYAKTLHVGKTSITIHVDVEAERFGKHGRRVRVTLGEVTFVRDRRNREKVRIRLTECQPGNSKSNTKARAIADGRYSTTPRPIQGELEQTARQLFSGRFELFGAGRTDAGVHALHQFAHLKSARLRDKHYAAADTAWI